MNSVYSGNVLSKTPTCSKYYGEMHMDNRKKTTFIHIVPMILIQTELEIQNNMTSDTESIICLHYATLPSCIGSTLYLEYFSMHLRFRELQNNWIFYKYFSSWMIPFCLSKRWSFYCMKERKQISIFEYKQRMYHYIY